MKLQEDDVVLILFNQTLGYIERIHSWQPLYDIRGLDGCMYRNQRDGEILLVRGLDGQVMERLREHLESFG